jgi:hypothetical protein
MHRSLQSMKTVLLLCLLCSTAPSSRAQPAIRPQISPIEVAPGRLPEHAARVVVRRGAKPEDVAIALKPYKTVFFASISGDTNLVDNICCFAAIHCEGLFVTGSRIDQPEAAALSRLPFVESIYVSQQKPVSLAVGDLAKCQSLTTIGFIESSIGKPVVAKLIKSKSLSGFVFDRCTVETGIIQEIANDINMRRLTIIGRELTTGEVQAIADARGLETVEFVDLKISDKDAATIATCKSLKLLRLSRTGASSECEKAIRQQRPNLELMWH